MCIRDRFPGDTVISSLAPSDLWGTYIKYIGAGAVATGGIISLIKSLPLIIKTFSQAMKSMSKKTSSEKAIRTELDLPMPILMLEMCIRDSNYSIYKCTRHRNQSLSYRFFCFGSRSSYRCRTESGFV